ncbi:hypothetical protein PFISCL1PPCAC_24387, partial [Pristionchus fissidentatus]
LFLLEVYVLAIHSLAIQENTDQIGVGMGLVPPVVDDSALGPIVRFHHPKCVFSSPLCLFSMRRHGRN